MNKLILQTRRPSRDGTDPGAVAEGWWEVIDGRVYLLDSGGKKTGESRTLPAGVDPKLLATRMLRSKISTPKSDFGRPLRYFNPGKSNDHIDH